MIVNFYPCRNRISKEIDQCTSLQNLERLLNCCSTCIYRIFEQALGMDSARMTYRRDAHDMNHAIPGLEFDIQTAGIQEREDRESLLTVC